MVLLGPSKGLSHGLLEMAHGTVIGVQHQSHGPIKDAHGPSRSLKSLSHGTVIGVQPLSHGLLAMAHGDNYGCSTSIPWANTYCPWSLPFLHHTCPMGMLQWANGQLEVLNIYPMGHFKMPLVLRLSSGLCPQGALL
jgi:hypothetical protein